MIEFHGRGILLDIEGTTSSIRFVYDEMFPFVRRQLNDFLSSHWDQPAVAEACELLAQDAGASSLADWCGTATTSAERQQAVRAEVVRLMDSDAKTTGLKALQGLIWQAGFVSGELVAHVYEDVMPALDRWTQAGIELRIYSSGSIVAQRLFFGHTQAGDLLSYFAAHYDTTTGSKKDAASYQKIAAEFGCPSPEILFLSDVVAELDAAQAAGLRTGLCRRPAMPPWPAVTVITRSRHWKRLPSTSLRPDKL